MPLPIQQRSKLRRSLRGVLHCGLALSTSFLLLSEPMITARAQSLWGSSPPGIGLIKTTQGEKDIHPLEPGKPI